MNTGISEPSSDATPIDLRAAGSVLKRQSRVLIYAIAAVAAATALFLSLATPRYQATALLLLDPASTEVLAAQKTSAGSSASESARIDSEVEVLRSDALALSVISQMALASDPEFMPPPLLPERLARFAGRVNAAPALVAEANAETIGRFREAIDIRRRGLTHVISVSAVSADPRKAADLANALSSAFIEAQVAGKVASSLAGRNAIEAQLAEIRERLAQSDARYDALFAESLQAAMSTKIGPGPDRLAALKAEGSEARMELAEAIRAMNAGDLAKLAGLTDNRDLADLVVARARAVSIDAPQATLAALDSKLNHRAQASIDALKSDIAALDREAADLQKSLQSSVSVDDLAPDAVAALYALRQDAEIARAQQDTLRTRMRELEAQAGTQLANARLVSPAVVPVRASYPDTGLVGLVALAAAMALGTGLAFLSEYVVGGVTSESQLSEVLKLPTAAEIPETSETNSGRMTSADRVVDAPLSAYSESLRRLQAAIDQPLREKGITQGQIVMVTSALAGEGKTTTALALARTYALAGCKTLMIDADLRNPNIHRQLGFTPETGLADYLRDPKANKGIHDFYARDPISPLAMILGAGRSPTATDPLLNGEAFLKILRQAREVYDVTIIDTPPILPVVDARYVATQVDAAVLAVKWASTRQSDLRDAAARLADVLPGDALVTTALTQSRSGRVTGPGYAQYYSNHSAAI